MWWCGTTCVARQDWLARQEDHVARHLLSARWSQRLPDQRDHVVLRSRQLRLLLLLMTQGVWDEEGDLLSRRWTGDQDARTILPTTLGSTVGESSGQHVLHVIQVGRSVRPTIQRDDLDRRALSSSLLLVMVLLLVKLVLLMQLVEQLVARVCHGRRWEADGRLVS